MVATRSEATRSGCVRQAGLLFCWRCEAISPKAVPQGPVAGTGILGRGSADARARRRSVSDAFLEFKSKWLLSRQSCGFVGERPASVGNAVGDALASSTACPRGPHCSVPALSARIDEPCSSNRIAPWTRRSSMASATVGSATV